MIWTDTESNLVLTLLPSNSEVLNTKYCESISTTAVLDSSRFDNDTNSLKLLRLKNSENVIIGQVNIILLTNKIELLRKIIWDKVDIIMISKTLLDSSIPEVQY